jgi:hypothetical protein
LASQMDRTACDRDRKPSIHGHCKADDRSRNG